jgi:lysophospholipase L1-like esterase
VSWARGVTLVTLASVIGIVGGVGAHARADSHADRLRSPRLFAVGHSWVVGTSSGRQIGYLDRLARQAAVPRVDADHSGFTAPQVRRLVESAPPCRPTDLAVVQVGLNDVRRFGEAGLPRFRRSMAAILARLDRCPVVVVQEPGALDYTWTGHPTLGSDAVVRDYRRATAALAKRHPNVTLVRPQLTADDYLLDGLHPNLDGNLAIARAIRHTAAWRTFHDVR